ncbi:MAG TPA: DUF222 domain-containing protein [Jatrophihabitans sp.]
MIDNDVEPGAFLAWLGSVDEVDLELPPATDAPDFDDEFIAFVHGEPGVHERLLSALDVTGVGPVEVAASLDPKSLTEAERLDHLAVIEQQISWLHALRAQALAALAAGDVSPDGWSQELVSCVLRVPGRTARRHIETSKTLTSTVPRTLSALGSGAISIKHAESIVEACWRLPADVTGAAIENAVLPQAAELTVAQLQKLLRQTVLALDPAGADQRHRRAMQDRDVRFIPAEDGMAELRALLPAPEAEVVFRRLTDATALLPATDTRTRPQQRADLLVDAVLCGIPPDALPERQGRRPAVSVVVSASTMLGVDDEPGYLDGYGPITARQVRELASDSTGTWRRPLTDPESGRLLDYGTSVYRPPQAIVDHVLARDSVCAFPTCNQPGYRCDIDHVRPYDRGGPTSADNTAPLCRRHHRCKTYGPFDYRFNSDGTFTWTNAYGSRYTSSPPRRWRRPTTPSSWSERLAEAKDEAGLDQQERQDAGYRQLISQLEREIGSARNADDERAIAEAERAINRARTQYGRLLQHRQDPQHPPF